MSATPVAAEASKTRWVEIDIMKGMAIVLVVLGHIVARELPVGGEWYGDLKYWIYKFHMPLFMYLAGLTFFLFQKPFSSLNDYGRFIIGRASRLLPALFLVGIAVVFAKAVLSGSLHIDNPVRDIWSDLLKLFYNPLGGVLVSVWFVYTLFVLYAIVGLFLIASQWNAYALVIAGMLVHFVPLTDLFCLSLAGEYWFMFALGCLSARHYSRLTILCIRYRGVFGALFLILSATVFLEWNEQWKKILLSLSSVPVAHWIASEFRGKAAALFSWLGFRSFVIYLLNTPFIGLTKALLFKVQTWDGIAFLGFAPVLLAAGLIGPLMLKSWIFSRSRLLDRMTG